MNEFNLFNILYLNIARDARLSQRLFNMDGMFKNKQKLKEQIVLERYEMEEKRVVDVHNSYLVHRGWQSHFRCL